MKQLQRYIYSGMALLVVSSLSSCLKDNKASVDFTTVQPVIEQLTGQNYFNSIANSNSQVANQNSYFMPVRVDSTGTFTDSITLNVAGQLIGKDVPVTIGIDNTAFATFNGSNGGIYQVLPSNAFTIINATVTIKSGTRLAYAYIKFNPKLIDFSQNYILPISITAATGAGISGNYGTIMYAIVPENQYSGLYQSVGSRVMGSNVYTINDLKYLYDFSGITAVQGGFPTAHASTPTSFVPNAVVTNCADQTIYLTFGEQMDLTINPDNTVTVSNDNLYGFGVFTYTLVPGTSTFDASTNTYHLSYGFVDAFSGDSSVVTETMTRIH